MLAGVNSFKLWRVFTPEEEETIEKEVEDSKISLYF